MRVSSANTLKRAAQTPSGAPDLLCHPVRERKIYTSRWPALGCEAAAPSGYHHLLLRPLSIGLLRVQAETNLCGKGLQWEGRCTGTIPLSGQQKPGSCGTENRHDWGLPWLQWTVTTSVVPCRALCAVDGHDVCSAVPFVLWMVTTSVVPCPLCCGWLRRL